MKGTIVLLILGAAYLAGCGRPEEKASMHRFNADIVLKVSVMQSGKLLVEGVETSSAVLDARLSQIESQNGVVWYYREEGTRRAPPEAMDVIKLVVKHGLPISMSSKPDFSDTIDEHGISRPRK